MAQILQHRRATTIELGAERGSIAEFWMDESKNTLVVMDGSTLGGHPLAKESAIPVNVSQLTNDAGYITQAAVFSGDYADLSNKPDLSVYQLSSTAFSGDYADLANKPTIPVNVSQLTNDSDYATVSQIPTNISAFNNNVGYITFNLMNNTINTALTPYATTSSLNAAVAPKIELTDISVGPENAPSGDGAITYDSGTGQFTYTPADLSSYITGLVEDPAPQLQGDLVTNNRKIVTTIGNIVLDPADGGIVQIIGDLQVSGVGNMPYTDGTSNAWAGSAPTTVSDAIDRLATAVASLQGQPIS